MGLIFGPQLLHITRVRPGILAPIVLVLAVVGAFALNFSITDVIVSIVFGLVAYAMRSINMPLIPVILGFILGPLVERSFLQTISSYGGPSGFITRPIALVLLILIVLVLVFEFRSSRRSRTREPEALERGVHSATRPTSLVVMSGFGLLATVAIVLATDFTFEGAQFPLMTAGLLLLLVVVYLAIALVPSLRRRFGGVISDGGSMEELTTQMQHEAVDLVENQPGSPPVIPGSADTEASPAATGPAHAATVLAQVEEDAPADPEDRRRLLVSLGLVLAMLLGSVLVGVALTVPVLLVLFLRLVTREDGADGRSHVGSVLPGLRAGPRGSGRGWLAAPVLTVPGSATAGRARAWTR
jgi:hypothetical protein